MTPAERERIQIPLDDYTRAVANEAAHLAVIEHVGLCPAGRQLVDIEKRVRRLEMGYAAFVGAMLGSGLIGGVAGGFLSNLMR